jgi:hypothetical protein
MNEAVADVRQQERQMHDEQDAQAAATRAKVNAKKTSELAFAGV